MIDRGQLAVMDETLHIEITPEQREMLMRGLRFVRSSVLLRCEDYNNETRSRREIELADIEELVGRLNGDSSAANAG